MENVLYIVRCTLKCIPLCGRYVFEMSNMMETSSYVYKNAA
jgi:hypothetical protein